MEVELKKLSDAEFEIMKIIWNNESPITSTMVKDYANKKNEWKISTVNTILSRLGKKGFIKSTKETKEREYFPVVKENDYLSFETKRFMKKFHNNSLNSFFSNLYETKEDDMKIYKNLYDELDKFDEKE